MMTMLNQIIALLPILIIGGTIIVLMLSIAYSRSLLRNVAITIIGLILSIVVAWYTVYCIQLNKDITYLIYIEYSSIFYVMLLVISSLASSILGYTWLLYYPTLRRDEFYLLLLISTMGGVLLTLANHLITFFLGMELFSIPVFILISYAYFQRKSIESGIKYIILSGVSSSFLLFGIAFLYCATGCLSFFDIQKVLLKYNDVISIFDQSSPAVLIILGFSMMMIAISFKLSCVPFHLWTADIYEGASSAISMYLSVSSKITIVFVLIRLLSVFPIKYYDMFYIFLSGSACCSMLFGSIMAVQQNNIKRILAYSSVTNSGYLLSMLILFRVNNTMVYETVSIYLISYLLSNIGAFGVINIMSSAYMRREKMDADMVSIYRGLFWRSPTLSIIFTIIILSSSGIPMTIGFIGKFYLLLTGISSKSWCLIIFIIFSSLISIFYYFKIIINLFTHSIDNIEIKDKILINWFNSVSGLIVTMVAIIILIGGLYPQCVMNLVHYVI